MARAAAAQRSDDEDLLTPDEVAAILRVPVVTLNSWRKRRRADGTAPGPEFLRVEGGRVRYQRSQVRAYIAERAAREAAKRQVSR